MPEQPGRPHHRRLTGPGQLRQPGHGQRRTPRGVPRHGLRDPLHRPRHRRRQRPDLGRERRGGGRGGVPETFLHVAGHL
ncbi:hypothetical protein SFR_2968 [Streptomyces sp. FR-008]|nr:hypothetical protein SFR_2968 [Streptomyces sp. FR-008]